MKNKKLLIIIISAVLGVCLAVGGVILAIQITNNLKNKDTATVKFDVNTTYETNVIQNREVKIGRRISQPKVFIKGDNPNDLNVYGWYKTKECKEEDRWNFKSNTITGNLTLYAKWVELYDVNYYVNGELHSTQNVFKGDMLEETAELVSGFKYLGSFTSNDYTTKFDFTAPIKGDTNIYVKRSAGLYLSDSEEEGLLSSASLTNYLTAACGTYTSGTEEGWVDEYTIAATGEKCTYVNFGFTPEVPDGFVELSLNLDISESQIIRLTYKNLGHAKSMNCYFTAMLDENTYSETGAWYNGDFCWPNSLGLPPIDIAYDMSEDDEWVTVDLNLYEIYKNGYSIWGTSPLLGAIRFEVGYKNFGDDDWSNEMLIKSIEGIPHEIIVDDSNEVKDLMKNASESELESAGSSLGVATGISFVKDHNELSKVQPNSQIFKTTQGMFFYAENEILAREGNGDMAGFTMNVPDSVEVDLSELTTLRIRLQNLGYADELIIYVYNEDGVPVKTTLELNKRMPEVKEYAINMYGLFGMEGKFSKVEFLYSSVGVDNLILFEKIWFSEFIPYDTVGINFNDKNKYGFTSNAGVDVEFDGDLAGIVFIVAQDGATVTSNDKSYDATNEGYAYMTLNYIKPEDSLVTKVKVELKVNGQFRTPYVYDVSASGINSVKLPLVKDEGGYVKSVRITFEGTGMIVLNDLAYSVNETSLPFYMSYETIYESFKDWKGEANFYEYDSKQGISSFIKGPTQQYLISAIYIGYSSTKPHLNPAHTTPNVKITGRTTVTLIYQNTTSTDKIGINLSFDKNDKDPGDGSGLPIMENHSLDIKANMGSYEWSAVKVVIEGENLAKYLDKYLAKISFEFHGDKINIRAMAIDVEG